MTRWFPSRARRALLVLPFLALALPAGPPARAASPPVAYAALGDSYSSGLGAGGYDLLSGTCYRGAHAYPVQWAARHAPASFRFVACAGATAAQVVATQLGALDGRTTLVTLSVGGNDVGFVAVVATCSVGSATACRTAVDLAEAATRSWLGTALAVTYGAVRAHAPNARLVVLGYPRIFELGGSCGVLGMPAANRAIVDEGADVLDGVIRSRAEASGAVYVDAVPAFAGHGVCAASPWINGAVLSVVDSFHPNAAGYTGGYLPALEAVTA